MSAPHGNPATAAPANGDSGPTSAVDPPIAVLWPARPGAEFGIKQWAHNDTRLRFVELTPLRPTGPALPSVPFDELELADKTMPDVLGAMRTLRDFKIRELGFLRAAGSTDFRELLAEFALDGWHRDPAVKRHSNWRAVYGGSTRLEEIPEAERDEKMCRLALERDIFNYPAVPERFRTDALGTAYLAAKRAKRARDEEEGAKTQAEEERKAHNREVARKRREAKKAEKAKTTEQQPAVEAAPIPA